MGAICSGGGGKGQVAPAKQTANALAGGAKDSSAAASTVDVGPPNAPSTPTAGRPTIKTDGGAHSDRKVVPDLDLTAGGSPSMNSPLDLDHHESRVTHALASKRIVLHRTRRKDIKAESFKDVLGAMKDEEEDALASRRIDKPADSAAFLVKALGANFLFSGLQDDELASIVGTMAPAESEAGTDVVQQGDSGGLFYVLEKGQAVAVVDGKEDARFEVGGHFGDLALLYNTPTPATVRAVTRCSWWTLDRATFRGSIVRNNAREINKNYKFLKKVRLLQALPAVSLHTLAEALAPVHFNDGAVIIKQGDPGNVFYIIKKGNVRVTKSKGGSGSGSGSGGGSGSGSGSGGGAAAGAAGDPPDATAGGGGGGGAGGSDGSGGSGDELLLELTVGDHFGERALLNDAPRAANVVAVGKVSCMALDREFFLDLLGPVQELMKSTHSQREVLADKNKKQREEDSRRAKEGGAAGGGGGGRGGSGEGSESKGKGKGGRGSGGGGGDGGAGDGDEETVHLRTDIRLKDIRPMVALGEGAFGVVQMVQHVKTREVWALKKMQKARIVKTGQQRNVMNEKRVLSTCQHPYILKLVATFSDRDCLYMLLEFLQGGDIFGHLYKQGGRFSGWMAQYYAATVLIVLEYLHNKHIAYRDLKPENLVLDSRGYLKVVDFGFAKTVKDRTYTLCGTPEYLAPELVQGKGHNKAVDYWALGILIYEMLCGYSPFADDGKNDQLTIYKNIIRGRVVFSSKCKDEVAKDLVLRLLEANPSARIGSLAGGAADVKAHGFFKGFDFEKLAAKKVLPPIIPEIASPTDTRNFDEVEVEANRVAPYKEGAEWCKGF